jgi:aryl-alcohol dehydrogenase-like predicted oxidoreductase
MNNYSRRNFLTSLAGGSICMYGILRAQAAPSATPPPQVPLGKTGITLSRIGQGTGMSGGNRQSNHTRMGFKKLTELFQHAYDSGITFFDLADLYGSHVYFREALRTIPRDKISILTKLWFRYDGNPDQVPADFKKRSTRMALERFRHEINTDRLDIVLLHCLMNPSWVEEMQPYMDALSEAKAKKQVRAVGVSCHDLGALKTASTCPWVDVILARINFKGVKMDGTVEQVAPILKTARENGKAVIGMKIYGEGSLANAKDECIQFIQKSGLVDTMTLGAEKPEQMAESLNLIAKYPTA